MNDIIVNKIQTIQRCIARARDEHRLAGGDFAIDFTRQDAAILNIIRACEQAIDLANHVIKAGKMGIPTTSAESFSLLSRGGVIDPELGRRLIGMAGFRNIVVHQYMQIDLAIVEAVIARGLDDLVTFTQSVTNYANLHDDNAPPESPR